MHIKVGDRVRLPTWDRFYTVTKVSNDYLCLKSTSGENEISYMLASNWIKEETTMSDKCKCINTEDAISILEAQGYTITPPTPPLNGEVYIYKDTTNPNSDGGLFVRLRKSIKLNHELIAIVPWTESQGLLTSSIKESFYEPRAV